MPAPLHIPPSVTLTSPMLARAAPSFGRVSVVIIARAAAWPASESRRNSAVASRMPCATRSIGRCCPITPVDITNTPAAGSSIASAASRAISRASACPCAPVMAFAQPLLITRARMLSGCRRSSSRSKVTAGDWILLVVKTAAAVQGRSLTTIARSSAPLFLIPHATPAARKPGTSVIAPASTKSSPHCICFPQSRLKRL